MNCDVESGWRHRLCHSFAIDLRTLAFFRICLAVLLLLDLVDRWTAVEMLYTDQGVMPRETLRTILGESVKWTSIHYYTGANSGLQSLALFVAGFIAVLLLVGWRTWIVTLACWVMLVSVNRRLPNSSTGADIILRLLLFWSLFLPLGAWWSLDSLLRPVAKEHSNKFASVATGAILLQVCYIYWFTVLYKMHPDWLQGKALGHALRLDVFARPFGLWLQQFEGVTSILTYMTLVLEAGLPLLVLSPWRNAACRWIGILGMWGLHLGIAMCLNLGLFPYVSMACWVLFIPGETWDYLAGRVRLSSHIGSVLQLRDSFSNSVRRIFPKRSQRIQPSKVGVCVVALLFAFVTLYNVLGVAQIRHPRFRIPRKMDVAARILRLDQKWSMFAPTPNNPDGWFTMPSMLADGTVADIWLNREFSLEKPANVAATFPNIRINRLMCNNRGTSARYQSFWISFASYFGMQWNATHPPEQAVVRTQVIYFEEAAHNQKPTPREFVDLQLRK